MNAATALVFMDADGAYIGIDSASGGYPYRTKYVLQAEHFPDTLEGREKAHGYKATIGAGSDSFGATKWSLCRMTVQVMPLEVG
ncbi:hypothetical protein ABIC83_002877 [Roseateles asaccharophilus]|uniref:hypothetical protein n=1 Tax=Roseateles asaccharophilus TaxID=582607 RepID=UPI0038396AE4